MRTSIGDVKDELSRRAGQAPMYLVATMVTIPDPRQVNERLIGYTGIAAPKPAYVMSVTYEVKG